MTAAMKPKFPEGVRRFPREEKSVTELVNEARTLMAGIVRMKFLYHEQQIKIGTSLIELKTVLKTTGQVKHGEWEEFYGKTFGDSGVSLRSAQKYMKLAHEAREKRTPSFSPRNDPEKDKAVEEHKMVVEAARQRQVVFRLSVPLANQEELDAMIRLWKEHRATVEKETIALLHQLLREARGAA